MLAARPGTRRVVLRSPDALLRDTLANWVDSLPGYEVTGAVSGGPALLKLCAVQAPDVAVVQLRSAETDELALIAELRGSVPHVVGLHHALDPPSLLRLYRAGANRLVSSGFGLSALRAALGEPERVTRASTHGLSDRELEILALISAGCSATEIAAALEISPHTVTNHKRRIFAKLDVHSRVQAAAEVARLGLLGGSVNGTRRTGQQPPDGKVVVVGRGQGGRSAVVAALRRGAQAVLTEDHAADRLPAVNSLVRAGYVIAPEDVVRPLLASALSAARPADLTGRERDILASVALGHSVRQTAQTLGIAIKTVQSEQRQLFSKLGARNRLDALALAREHGLIDP
jgi:DNA-binding NarL/FixJ family response regulator